jgi:hypothetical protein
MYLYVADDIPMVPQDHPIKNKKHNINWQTKEWEKSYLLLNGTSLYLCYPGFPSLSPYNQIPP